MTTPKQSFTLVDRLIARCLGDDPRSAAHEISRSRLWEPLVNHACDAQVGGLLHQRLEHAGIDAPPSAMRTLRVYRDHLAARHKHQLEQTSAAFDSLKRAGIPFVVLKGAALAAAVYASPGARAMDDIDILVNEADATRTEEAMKRAGCQPGPDLLSPEFYPRYYYEREYLTAGQPAVKIDCHVRPFRPLRYGRTVPADAFRDDLQTVAIGGHDAQILSPTNQMIHLCAHAACHGSSKLRWLADIAALWRTHHASISDATLIHRCRQWSLAWPVYRTLQLVGDLFQLDQDSRCAALMSGLRGRWSWRDRLAVRQAPYDVDRPLAALMVNLATTPGWAFKLGYLRTIALPGPSHLGQLYAGRHPGWPLVAHAKPLVHAVPFLRSRAALSGA